MTFSAGGFVGCTMKTSAPRTFSSMRTKISPSAKRVSVTFARSTPRCSRDLLGERLLAVPERSLNPRRHAGQMVHYRKASER